MRNHRLFFTAALLLSPTVILPLRADPPEPVEMSEEKGPPRRPRTLQEIAGEIIWNPQQQGVLLIVAPQETLGTPWILAPGTDVIAIDDETSPALPMRSREGLRLSVLESYFDRQAVPCGDVTTLAPTTMTVLNDKNLPEPSPALGMTPEDCFRALQGTLTETQWRKLSSAAGLGLGDLSGKQRSWFLGALPRDMDVVVPADEKSEKRERVPVSPAQRDGMRFHLYRTMGWSYSQGENHLFPIFRPYHPSATPELYINPVNREGMNRLSREQYAFGKEVLSVVRAYAKPGQLTFDAPALDAMVRLNKITTLGELVDRVRETTHVEIYADERYGRMEILLCGDQARAGNLLKACARAVTGTYRKVGPAYVLTDDLVGLAVRQLHLHEWMQANSILAVQAEAHIHQSFDTLQPDQFIGFAPDDKLAPSQAVQERYAAYEKQQRRFAKDDPRRNRADLVPVNLLPPSAQEIIQKEIGEVRRDPNSGGVVLSDQVELYIRIDLTVEVPGVGTVKAPYSGALRDEETPSEKEVSMPRPLPARWKIRAVFLENGTAEQLAMAFSAAKRAGFTEVWLEADPAESQMTETLAERVRQAAQAGLKLRAVVRGGRGKNIDRTQLATNVLGETTSEYLARSRKMQPSGSRPPLSERDGQRGDWLDLDAPNRTAALIPTVEALAKIPGLAGIVISDLAPPSLYPLQPHMLESQDPRFPGLQTGYSDARRLTFLRRFHIDPIDIAFIDALPELQGKPGRYRSVDLPYLGLNFMYSESAPEWRQFQADRVEADRAELQDKLKSIAPPIWYYQNYRDAPNLRSFVESCDKTPVPSKKPAQTTDVEYTTEPLPPDAPRARSTVFLNALSVSALSWNARDPLRDNFLHALSIQFDPANPHLKTWDGLVLDMTDESLSTATAHLRQLPLPTDGTQP